MITDGLKKFFPRIVLVSHISEMLTVWGWLNNSIFDLVKLSFTF